MVTRDKGTDVNFVHQSAILSETINKELKNQKLYTNYSVNPFKKMYTLTGKPNSLHDSADGEEDDKFLEVVKRAHQTPTQKFEFPQTSNQDYGWNTEPLIDHRRGCIGGYMPKDKTQKSLNTWTQLGDLKNSQKI